MKNQKIVEASPNFMFKTCFRLHRTNWGSQIQFSFILTYETWVWWVWLPGGQFFNLIIVNLNPGLLVDLYHKHVPGASLSRARKDGILFYYKYDPKCENKQDPAPCFEFRALVKSILRIDRSGCLNKSTLQRALIQYMADENIGREIATTMDARGQAANFKQVFIDLKRTLGNTTTGIRLPDHVKTMLTLMRGGLTIFNVCK